MSHAPIEPNFRVINILPTSIFEAEVPPDLYADLVSIVTNCDWDESTYLKNLEKYQSGAVSTDLLKQYRDSTEVEDRQQGILHSNLFDNFRVWCENQLNQLLPYIVKEPFATDMEINAAWINRYRLGENLVAHCHPWAVVSGTVFLTGNSGDVQFVKRNAYSDLKGLGITRYSDAFTYPVSPGKMVIFPSSLSHRVLPNESDAMRYTLAFNAMPTTVYDGHTVQFIKRHKPT